MQSASVSSRQRSPNYSSNSHRLCSSEYYMTQNVVFTLWIPRGTLYHRTTDRDTLVLSSGRRMRAVPRCQRTVVNQLRADLQHTPATRRLRV